MSYQLIDAFQRLGKPRLLVLGDVILDRYIWGDAERVSQEAPVILLREEQTEVRLGGAANVANMLRGLQADVTMAGIVGNDPEGERVRNELQSSGVDCQGLIVDAERPTTLKQRYIGRAQHRHPHQMLRVDRELRKPLGAHAVQALLAAILPLLEEHQAVLISDYAKGVCTPDVVPTVIAAARQAGLPVIVDPPSSGQCGHYQGATAMTPNRLETERATGREIRTIHSAFSAGRRLCAELQLESAFVTLDSDGIALVRADGSAEHLPTRRREVYDITGAGDMVLAMIGVGAAAGIQPADLARLANVAGGLEVEQIGVVTVSREEILADLMSGGCTSDEKICTVDDLSRQLAARRALSQRIVFTNGCFDLLHVGHVTYLEQASREGECLVVAINSDASVRRLNKGSDRPVFPQQQRATMLAALEAVDYVVVFDEATPQELLACLKPDMLVKGGTYCYDEIVGREIVEAYGGQVKVLAAVPGISTTRVLERVRGDGNASSAPQPGGRIQRKAG